MGQIFSCIIEKCLCVLGQKVSNYTNKHSGIPISTPELLESVTHTNSSSELHQNVIDICIDIVQESRQDSASSFSSAHVWSVDDLQETKNGGSVDTNKHISLPISPPESLESLIDTYSRFKLHQNGTDTCIDILEESSQGSASSADVWGLDNLEETKNGGSDDTNKHSSRSIYTLEFLGSLTVWNSSFKVHQNVTAPSIDFEQESSQDSVSASADVWGVDNLEETKNGGSDDTLEFLESLTDRNSSFKVHQNVTAPSIDFEQESSQVSASASADIWGVDNLEKTKNGGSDDANKHSSQPISTRKFLESLSDRNSRFKAHQNGIAPSIDIAPQSSRDSAFAYVLGVNNLEETRNGGLDKWFRHYCSAHKMLLVGEGDFSFSASLAVAFGSAKNMVATSLDSIKYLSENYKWARSNIYKLMTRGCTVLHGVDATKMANHRSLGGSKFDRIIYNFPHAGFRSNEPVVSQKYRHQSLVSLFFKNAKEMIHENGEVHVTHKCNPFFLAWDLESLASAAGLRLIEEVPFHYTDYPGYRTKYGYGSDKNSNSNPSKRYKFGLVPNVPKRHKVKRIEETTMF